MVIMSGGVVFVSGVFVSGGVVFVSGVCEWCL